jgi:hypothetical protein
VDRAKPFDIPSEGQLIDPIARGSVGRCYSAASLTDFCRRVAYAATPDAAIDAEELQARGADAILLDCIGFTQRPGGSPAARHPDHTVERGCR